MSGSLARTTGALVIVLLGVNAVAAQEAERREPKCKEVHATLVEDGTTVGCKPEHPDCFLGEIAGNRGLRGRTYFRSDAAAAGPSTSPSFISYSGLFEYHLRGGTIVARETGVFDRTVGRPSSGAITAYHQITSATGDWEGATGHFFVSGFRVGQHVETEVTGLVCMAR